MVRIVIGMSSKPSIHVITVLPFCRREVVLLLFQLTLEVKHQQPEKAR